MTIEAFNNDRQADKIDALTWLAKFVAAAPSITFDGGTLCAVVGGYKPNEPGWFDRSGGAINLNTHEVDWSKPFVCSYAGFKFPFKWAEDETYEDHDCRGRVYCAIRKGDLAKDTKNKLRWQVTDVKAVINSQGAATWEITVQPVPYRGRVDGAKQ
jgi:hypothetical protein